MLGITLLDPIDKSLKSWFKSVWYIETHFLFIYSLCDALPTWKDLWLFIKCGLLALSWHHPHLPPTHTDVHLWTSGGSDGKRSPPATRETWIQSLGWEDPLEEGMATHSSILAWRIPWMEQPGGLQSMGSQRVGQDWAQHSHHSTKRVISNCGRYYCRKGGPLPGPEIRLFSNTRE